MLFKLYCQLIIMCKITSVPDLLCYLIQAGQLPVHVLVGESVLTSGTLELRIQLQDVLGPFQTHILPSDSVRHDQEYI